MDDPKGQPLAKVREVRDEIRERVEEMLMGLISEQRALLLLWSELERAS